MNAVIYESPESGDWQAVYKAAIAEVDATKLPDRIAEAKRAIVTRARELFPEERREFRGGASSRYRSLCIACASWHAEVPIDCAIAGVQRS